MERLGICHKISKLQAVWIEKVKKENKPKTH